MRQPYYEDELVTLYCGDMRDILPLLGVYDLLLTDPPYGINVGKKDGTVGGGRKEIPATEFGKFDWDNEPAGKELLEMMRNHGRDQIIWGGNYFELPAASGWLVWDKQNGETDFADCELAWTNLESAVRLYRYRWNGYLQGEQRMKERRVHPTQKPLPLMRWCIDRVKGVPKSILDPMCGSGTTLIAAAELGIKVVGIEKEERYCRSVVERLGRVQLRIQWEESA